MNHIIVNPASRSGRGMKVWRVIEAYLDENQIEYQVHFTKKEKDATAITRKITSSIHHQTDQKNEPKRPKRITDYDNEHTIVVLGGDGTMNEVIQGITNFKETRIGYIPTGSSNDLCRSIGYTKDPIARLKKIFDGSMCVDMDLGRTTIYNQKNQVVSSQRFIVSSGAGFDALVCDEAFRSVIKKVLNKIGLGKLTYLGIALKHILMRKMEPCTISLEGEKKLELDGFLFAACMNHPYEGGGFQFCKNADYRDHLLDLCVVGNMPKPKMFLALPTAYFGKHTMFSDVYMLKGKEFTLETKSKNVVHTDGEIPGKGYKVKWEVMSERLRIVL